MRKISVVGSRFVGEKGFTMIELMVVMSIISILVVVGMGSYKTAQLKARDAKRKSDLEQISKALELYMNDHQMYPDDNGSGELLCCEYGEEFSEGGDVYMGKMPEDPKDRDGWEYFYRVQNSGQSYQLYARLENVNDPRVEVFNPAIDCGAEDCNYGVSSSDLTP